MLYLCIAPIGEERRATPVLRIDFWAIDDPQWTPLLVEGFGRRPSERARYLRTNELPLPFAIDRHVSGNMVVTHMLFLPINGTVCKDWFGFKPSLNRYWPWEWPLRDRALGGALSDARKQVTFSSFGSDTLAAFVEKALYDDTAGLDLRLKQQVERLKDAFDASQAAARHQTEASWEKITQRWSADLNDQ